MRNGTANSRAESRPPPFDAIESALAKFETLRSHFLGLTPSIEAMLREIENTNGEIRDAEGKFERLSVAHRRIGAEHAELTIDRNVAELKANELRARLGGLEEALRQGMADLDAARARLTKQTARGHFLERELEEFKSRLATVSRQLPLLRAEFADKERRLLDIEQQRANLEEDHVRVRQELRRSLRRIEDMDADAAKLRGRIHELEARHDRAIRRIGELDGALAAETLARAGAEAAKRDAAETRLLDVADLEAKRNGLSDRSQDAERRLAEARRELRERDATFRALEHGALQSAVLLSVRDRTLVDLERAVISARDRQSATEAARLALEDRVGALSRALDVEASALTRAKARTSVLEARRTTQRELTIRQCDGRDNAIARLRADLETHASARFLAEGALAVGAAGPRVLPQAFERQGRRPERRDQSEKEAFW